MFNSNVQFQALSQTIQTVIFLSLLETSIKQYGVYLTFSVLETSMKQYRDYLTLSVLETSIKQYGV